jgi:hypothetical protein
MNNEVLMGSWSQERVRSLFWTEFMYVPRYLTKGEWQDAVEIWETMGTEKGSGYTCVKAVAQYLGLDLEDLNTYRKGF